MPVELFDSNGKVVSYHDLQDKTRWCIDGESMEQAFVRSYPQLRYVMNPEKVNNPYAPDLLHMPTKKLTDLKTQHSPFFKAGEKYGIDPTFAVVFNVKDQVRYQSHYPDIDILYFVEWIPIRADIYGRQYQVSEHKGVYRASFQSLNNLLAKSEIHEYQQRVNDTAGNAKGSYVLDIRDEIFQRLL